MPTATADIKVDAVRGFGGEVLLHGANLMKRKPKRSNCHSSRGWLNAAVRPSDGDCRARHAGWNCSSRTPISTAYLPVGGGGLAAGVAVLIKQLMPQIKVIAVEAEDSACLKAALDAGHPVDLLRVDAAEGVAVNHRHWRRNLPFMPGVSRRYHHRR